jgi:hypothetical protein
MPLSEGERVERQVLRHLIFHARTPVILRADAETCRAFECGGAEELASRLADMHENDLFRILPAQGEAGDPLGPPVAKSDTVRRAERRRRIEKAFLFGLSVLVTSEGIRRLKDLRKKTTQVRLEDWRKTGPETDAGRWVRGNA